MDRATEERWRAALEKKGMNRVRADLDMRPGRPADLVFDIGDEPPYPTRGYCEQWCRGAPAKGLGISGPGATVAVMAVLVVVCILRAISSWSTADANWLSAGTVPYSPVAASSSTDRARSSTASPPAATVGASGQMAGASASTGETADPTQAIMNNSIISTVNTRSILPACSSVSAAPGAHAATSLPPCSKLGIPTTQQKQGSPHGIASGAAGPGTN